MSSTWDKVLSSRAADVQQEILTQVSVLERRAIGGQYIFPSLRADRFIPRSAIKRIFRLVRDSASRGAPWFLQEYKDLCHDYSLRGGNVWKRYLPEKVGRAVHRTDLLTQLGKANRRIRRNEFATLVRHIIRGAVPHKFRLMMPRVRMTKNAAWVTWHAESNGVEEPFTFAVPRCADEIRACMGLPYRDYGKPILLITYDAADAGTLFRPTCADAALETKFWPSPPPPPAKRNAHGWTRAWTEWAPRPKATRQLVATGQPEAVHASALSPPSLAIEHCKSLIVL